MEKEAILVDYLKTYLYLNYPRNIKLAFWDGYPQNSHAETLPLNEVSLGGGAFGRLWVGHEGGALIHGISALKRGHRELMTRRKPTNQEAALARHQICQSLDLASQASELWEINVRHVGHSVYGSLLKEPNGLRHPLNPLVALNFFFTDLFHISKPLSHLGLLTF